MLLNKTAELALGDGDVHADVRQIVKSDHIARAHSNTAETCGRSDSVFFGRAVNVNASVPRSTVLLFHSTQPDHPRDNRVSSWRVRINDFAGRHTVLDYRSGGQVIAK